MRHKYTADDRARVCALYSEGRTAVQISEATLFSRTHVLRIVRSAGLSRPSGARRTFSTEQVTAMYASGKSMREVAQASGVPRGTVQTYLNIAGLSRSRSEGVIRAVRRRGNAKVNRSFSFDPLNPDSAWLLGLVMGDGWIAKTRWMFGVVSGDHDVIYKVQRIAGGTVRSGSGRALVVNVHSAELARRLCVILGHPGGPKASTVAMPAIADDMLPHVIRGLVDSDGSLSMTGRDRKYLRLAFYSCSLRLVESFVTIAHRLAGVEMKKVHTDNNRKSPTGRPSQPMNWVVYGDREAKRIGEWIYGVSHEGNRCERKFSIWNAAIAGSGNTE